MSTTKSIKPKIVVVCGQTGSGKTSLAVLLCQKFNGEIVNADSRQVYKEMDIGTAKGLDPKNHESGIMNHEIGGIPIHLVNIVSPNERYNVGQFKKDAEEAVAGIISRGKVPFVVGGTGLYIDALVDNFQIPSGCHPRALMPARNALACEAGAVLIGKSRTSDFKNKSLQELIKILEKVDPQALKIVDLKNRRRVERALEYCLTTGKKFSESRKKGERKYEVLKIAPKIACPDRNAGGDRELLHKKIDQRVEEMIHAGLEKEVKILAEKYGWESEAMTGIGYREWRGHFVGAGSPHPEKQGAETAPLQEIKNQIKLSTRQYAKRQMTWFKRDKEINWISSVKQVESLIKKFLKQI